MYSGYKRRNAEEWRQVRLVYTLLYNTNVEKRDRKEPFQLLFLPGDEEAERLFHIKQDIKNTAELERKEGEIIREPIK